MNKLAIYDASALVGLNVAVANAAIESIDADGETCVEIPRLDELLAAAATMRCLMPARLRGSEIKAIRKILGLTQTDLAAKISPATALETMSRWESEVQRMGACAEKVFRLVACEALKARAPGAGYDGSLLADLDISDETAPPIRLVSTRQARVTAWRQAA